MFNFNGWTGRLSEQPGFDYMASAFAGITEMIGEEDRPPAQVTMAVGDSATGMSARDVSSLTFCTVKNRGKDSTSIVPF